MTLKLRTCSTLVCDNCGAEWGDTEYEYVVHFKPSDRAMALDYIADSDWTTGGDKDHCGACPTLVTPEEL